MDQKILELLQQGMAKHTAGAYQEAEMIYRQVLSIQPEQPDAIHFIGVLAFNVGNYKAAKEYLNKAIELIPENAACYNNMGNVCQKEGDLDGAVKYYEKTLSLDPSNFKAYSNLGAAFIRLGQYNQAKINLEKAISIEPNYAGALNNLGESHSYLGNFNKAHNFYIKAIELEPHLADAHWNLSLSLLLRGEFEKGFEEYEWRWKRPDTPKRDIDPQTLWQGEALNGKSILVYEEQGLGDALQFVRYLPMIKEMGGRVILEVSPVLARLFVNMDSVDKLWVRNMRESTRDIDRFDYHIPVLGLPRIFKTRLSTIPFDKPYVSISSSMVHTWARRLGEKKGFRIGIVWAGNPDHRNDHNRSCLLSQFKEISELPDVELISLQKDKYDNWTDIEPLNLVQHDLADDIHDFADTAAVIENLDLIISVDTAVVHLAGGMGKEVWVLLPFYPDWRWMLERKDSPWYPCMRLFRQEKTGGWAPVFKNIKKELQILLKDKTHES